MNSYRHLIVLRTGLDATGVQIGHFDLVGAASAIYRQDLADARRQWIDGGTILEDGRRGRTDAWRRYRGRETLSGGQFHTFDV